MITKTIYMSLLIEGWCFVVLVSRWDGVAGVPVAGELVFEPVVGLSA